MEGARGRLLVFMENNTENDLLAILVFASSRVGAWVTAASCVRKCGIESDLVNHYLERDDFEGVADHFHYRYRIAQRLTPPGYPGARRDSRGSFVFCISVIQDAY